MNQSTGIKIGVVDDHQLFVRSLSNLIDTFAGFTVVLNALNGEELSRKIEAAPVKPDILLLDVNMPIVDGVEAAKHVSQQYPDIRIVALSTNDSDNAIISMLRAGCCAYLLKDIHPNELEKALQEIYRHGFYNADVFNLNYRRLILNAGKEEDAVLSEKEKIFLQLACSDLTYKEIAGRMHLSERTIDGYREAIFGKFKVQSRVGMAIEAIRRKLVSL
jgi:DNA-binding NarL/FixJ family response regulator